jgi:hypothetical protein
MADSMVFEPGGYRYVPGPFQYSGGVAALPGFEIERARFSRPPALPSGLRAVEGYLGALGRPLTALCAFELRSPAQFSEDAFVAFNRAYVEALAVWGLIREEANPVARSNVCPELASPREPCVEAFCYTAARPSRGPGAPPSFVVAGSGESPEGAGSYRDHIVRLGETTPDALREKAAFVLGAMEQRLAALVAGWGDAAATQVYTVHDLHPFLADAIVARGAARNGITWHYARPPVTGLEFEMDVRGIALERVLFD